MYLFLSAQDEYKHNSHIDWFQNSELL